MGFWIFLGIIVGAVAIYIEYKRPYWRGKTGENFVSGKLFRFNATYYKILDNLLLPSSGNLSATQIDHVVVSNYGIFCIETKAYKGWIFGSANQEYWTQVIYRYKKRFYNPLRQNYAHVKAIEELVKPLYPKAQIISLVVFPYADKLKISGTDLVGCARDVVEKIESYKVQVFTDSERDKIYEILTSANIQDKEARKLHDRGARDLRRC